MHFCFFAQFVEFSLNIANICAAAARAVCSCVVWASGDYRTRYLKGARMQLFWTLWTAHSSTATDISRIYMRIPAER